MEYLYNGVQLPVLPEWDKSVYPYAYITRGASPRRLILTSTRLVAYDANGRCLSNINYLIYELIDGEWIEATYAGTFYPLWCSEDLYYSSAVADVGGTLYLAASTPIPVGGSIPEQTFLGMLIAQFGVIPHVMGKGGKEPVAYLYGPDRVRLPKLPEWDKSKYPYAFITLNNSDSVFLFFYQTASAIKLTDSGIRVDTSGGITARNRYKYDADSNSWSSTINTVHYGTNIVWTSVDLYSTETEELLLTASDPIPVYE